MPFIVCKFGGSSLAAGDRCLRVRDSIRSDPSRRALVVSAPGRRDARARAAAGDRLSALRDRLSRLDPARTTLKRCGAP